MLVMSDEGDAVRTPANGRYRPYPRSSTRRTVGRKTPHQRTTQSRKLKGE